MLAPFVGRAAELADVAERLAASRLVTIVGPGGVGKTRLASEVARTRCGDYADGAWLVELAGVEDPDLVEEAVAGALGVQLAPEAALGGLLARRHLLVVLDNCEHLAAAVARLCDELLGQSDDLRILATSRRPLGVDGESRYRLAGLSVPDEVVGGPDSDALALFSDRARRADRRFVLDDTSAATSAQIVTRLAGNPLAIELAAAWVESLGLEPLLGHLETRLLSPEGAAAPGLTRQRSLRSTIDWSYEQLAAPPQRVFRRLSAFPGAFTLEAAEAVAGPDANWAVPELVDASLLEPPRRGPDGRMRYLMLETLRHFATERLGACGELAVAREDVARWALGAAEGAAEALRSPATELEASRALDADGALLDGVLASALEHQPAVALRLAVALAPRWFTRGRWQAGYTALAAAAERAGADDDAWSESQFWLGLLTVGMDPEVSVEHLTRAGDAAPASSLRARALAWRAGGLCVLGHVEVAEASAGEGLQLAEQAADPTAQASALYWLSGVAMHRGSLREAATRMQRAHAVVSRGVPGWISRQVAIHLAEVMGFEAADDALRLCEGALEECEAIDALYDLGDGLCVCAQLELRCGRVERARELVLRALELYGRTGARVLLQNALGLAVDVCARGDRWTDVITLVRVWRSSADFEEWPELAQPRMSARDAAVAAVGEERAAVAEALASGLSPTSAAELAAAVLGRDARAGDTRSEPSLTVREQELVGLVARGRTNAEIARELSISLRTVGSHLDRIRDKTGCRRRADLTRLAVRIGLD